MDFQDVHKLENKVIEKGERWILSAGFNVKPDLKNTERIDVEIEDIKQIIDAGGTLVILSHQGGSGGDEVTHLDFVADYLSEKLKIDVKYFPENTTSASVNFTRNLKLGQVAILGNTRFHNGEKKNDTTLANKFAGLGDFVAVGGFSKAHREHASNVGLLDFKPGFITRSQTKEMELLAPWCGKNEEYSVAILGGIKKEKILSLAGFSEIYDFIIPGGIVLNTILKAKGFKIGNSIIEECGKTFEKYAENVLNGKNKNKIYIPSEVIIAEKSTNRFENSRLINISEGVPAKYTIVDFILTDEAEEALQKAVNSQGRILLAGTPALYDQGFNNVTDKCISYLEQPKAQSIILGGDSIRELPFQGTKSSGGGSSLEFLCTETTVVYEALKRNKQKFPGI